MSPRIVNDNLSHLRHKNEMQIHILPEDVVNQIAAGEVVERPAHLIKELIENSIDAGSTQISIEVSESGRNVVVKDNGKGIPPEHLSIALDRHTTSKIAQIDDLWKLNSFGFRGEALASISSVSHLVLTSKQKDQPKSFFIESEFGKKSTVLEKPIDKGTEVKISALFENIPARLKFLKSGQSEYAQIKTLVKALALAHPKVEIKLIIEGKVIFYFTAATNLLGRSKQVFELESLYFSELKNDQFHAQAVFADPHHVNKTSKNIFIFAQNRWINDKSLQAAVMEAFRNTLMHGEFPYCAVFLQCDPQLIDINIHPTKSQVKFVNPSDVFRVVYHTLRNEIEKAPWVPQRDFSKSTSDTAEVEKVLAPQTMGVVDSSDFVQQDLNLDSMTQVQFKQKKSFLSEDRPVWSATTAPSMPVNEPVKDFWSRLQVLAQAHLTYILTQDSDGLVIVDQHAAHERVVFETLMRQFKSRSIEVQSFLMPLVIDMDPEKAEKIIENKSVFAELGIDIESMGPSSLAVNSAPVIIKDGALSAAVMLLAEKLEKNSFSFSLENVIGDIFASMACHSAIRAGQSLSFAEMVALLKSMDQFPLSSFCPHGRPVSIKISQYQLEKDFSRLL